jgi:hypothetical protein
MPQWILVAVLHFGAEPDGHVAKTPILKEWTKSLMAARAPGLQSSDAGGMADPIAVEHIPHRSPIRPGTDAPPLVPANEHTPGVSQPKSHRDASKEPAARPITNRTRRRIAEADGVVLSHIPPDVPISDVVVPVSATTIAAPDRRPSETPASTAESAESSAAHSTSKKAGILAKLGKDPTMEQHSPRRKRRLADFFSADESTSDTSPAVRPRSLFSRQEKK